MSFPEDPTEDQIQKMLRLPDYFSASSGHPVSEDPEHWCLGPVIRTRDSGLIDQSNAAMLEKHLESMPELEEDWSIQSASHWACGWVDHLSFRLLDSEGKVTKIYHVLREWFDALEDYPLADDDDHSQREREATLEYIEYNGRRFLKSDAPSDWVSQVELWLEENDPKELESRDDQGGAPSDGALKGALEALGLAEEEEDE